MPRTAAATKTVRSTKTTTTRKAPAKATLVKKVQVKKTVFKAEKEVKPVKYTFTKSTLAQELSDRSHLDKKAVVAVLAALEDVILGSVHKRGVGEFTLPGLFKVVTKKIAARKGGKEATSPFTGETYVTKAKPATVRVRVRAGSKLKNAAL